MPDLTRPLGLRRGTSRRDFLAIAATGTAAVWLRGAVAAQPGETATRGEKPARARISIRVGVGLWSNDRRRDELLALAKAGKELCVNQLIKKNERARQQGTKKK